MTCLACGPTSARPSKEHVFSDWLLRFLKAKNVPTCLFRLKSDGSREPVRQEIALDAFRLKRICAACNNGWMSELEGAAKPIMEDLLTGVRIPHMLEESTRQVLARWAAKTAIIESYAVGAESPAPSHLLGWMRTQRHDYASGRFAATAAPVHFSGVGHLQVGWIMDLLGGRGQIAAGNIVVLAFPNLVLTCAFPLLGLGYRCRCDLSVCAPLWPTRASWDQIKDPWPMPPVGCALDEVLQAMAGKIELFQSMA